MQNKALRFFLGVGKYTPVAALQGDMGWEPSIVKQWTCIGRFLVRMSCTANNRINKRIALWASAKASSRCKNWFYVVRKRISDWQMNIELNINQTIGYNIVQNLQAAVMGEFKNSWYMIIHIPVGPSRRGGNKLRTYALFTSFFETESYCKMIMPLPLLLRCRVAPLRIETGRFENKPLEERKCPFCDNVESEQHVLLDCCMYDDLRADLFYSASNIASCFNTFSIEH